MKFKAKPKLVDQTPSDFSFPVDKDGYIYGWYIDGYIVGDFVEVNEEYTNLEWWCPVDVSTLEVIIADEDKTCWCYISPNIMHNGPIFEPLFKNKHCPNCGRQLNKG